MKITTARLAAIAATATVVLFGATTATAGGSPTIPDGSVWQADMAKAVNDAYLRDFGKGSVVKTIPAHSISSARTTLGSFKLPPGTWLITSNATFTRAIAADAGATKTRPQLALRYGMVGYKGGTSAGLIAGVDISPAQGGVLTGSTVQTVTLPNPTLTTVWVYGSGVNDDGSDCADSLITVAAQITATRIG